MIVVAFLWFAVWGVLAVVICGAVFALTWRIQGAAAAAELANAWFSTFNGIIVGAAGFGAVAFIRRERFTVARAIEHSFDVPDAFSDRFKTHLGRVRSWRWATLGLSALLLVIGGFIAINARIPLQGFSHYALTLAVISFYFVGGLGLMVLVALLRLFRFIETHAGADLDTRISLRSPVRRHDLQAIDFYFIISSAMAIFAVYVCFRTTLTAFHSAPPAYYKTMIIPVLFFLPAALVYSFYPRWVVRQVWDADALVAIETVANNVSLDANDFSKPSLEMRKLILDVREKMLAERRSAPLFTLKDAPTLTMAILMLLQLIAQKDPVLSNYFNAFR